MIIYLKGADFSAKNIGTLSTWMITKSLGDGATSSNLATFVDRDAAYETVITIEDGYEIVSADVVVTMGGTAVDYTKGTDSNGRETITISISKVTGPIVIRVPTKAIEEEPENYTFTINPTPSTATVTLTASGYTQSGNSITVPSGTIVSWSVSADGYTTQSGTQNVTNTSSKSVTLSASGDEEGGNTDAEIGTTTTFGSTNVEVTIIGKFSDFNFANKCVISTSGGSSCSLNTTGSSGRISSPNQVLKVSGGETVTFNSSISGLQYALIEFTGKPCTISTLNKSGYYGQGWTTEASTTLHSNTKYLGINFNNGSTDMTSEQLESLKTAIVLS